MRVRACACVQSADIQLVRRAFLSEAINKALAYGERIGIYTSASQWEPIMGNWAGGARFPLW